MAASLHFVSTLTLPVLADRLGQVACGQRSVVETLYLDRADRWLRRHGWLLECTCAQQQVRLRLRRLDQGSALTVDQPTCVPATVAAIHAPAMRARLTGLLGDCALECVQRWHSEVWHGVHRDQAGVDICAIVLTAHHSGRTTRPLDPPLMLELIAQRGYGRATRAWAGTLPNNVPVTALAHDCHRLLEQAYVAAAIRVPSMGDTALVAGQPALPVIADVLLVQALTMAACLPPAATALGPEQVHDFRVALRRSRALLRGFKQVVGADLERHFRREFAWLSRATSRLRDLDVMAAEVALPAWPYGELAEPERAALGAFIDQLRAHDQAALLQRLQAPRYTNVQSLWQTTLAHWRLHGAGAGHVLGACAGAAIAAALARTHRQAVALLHEPSTPALHELRKRYKRLRYLVEPCAALYARVDVGAVLTELKRLQTMLGERCDWQAQLALLARWRRRRAAPRLSPALRAALSAMHRRLHARVTLALAEDATVLDAVGAFDHADRRGAFADLVRELAG